MSTNDSLQLLSELGFREISHTKSVTSAVTTAWGVNWDAELVARDLMQNFFDADRHRVGEIKVALDRDSIRVSSPTPYNLERLYFLGSEKGPDDVGQYGEGFKAAATCVLREHGSLMVAASENQVVRIRIDDKPVNGTKLYPLVYDFFTTKSPCSGNILIIRGATQKLAHAMERGLDQFFFVGNPLIGNELASHGRDFVVYQSTTPDGHIFYRNLKRGGIPGLPLVLVLNKEYAAIEKKIASDRDRKAFGEDVRNLFYSVWAKSFFKGWQSRERIAVEAARECWENGEGHPLLSEIASYGRWMSGWDAAAARSVFGDRFFARSQAKEAAIQLRYQDIEGDWRRQGMSELPAYFARFGLRSAERHITELEEKARKEAREKEHRSASSVESRAIAVLVDLVRGFAPEIMAVFDRGRTSYSIAKTEVVLGELKQIRQYRSREVFLSEDVFTSEFPRALAVFLHEHSHIFGFDGSRGFTDALTELLEVVVRHRDILDDYEARWNGLREEIAAERMISDDGNRFDPKELDSIEVSELRALFRSLPPAVLEQLLMKRRSKSKENEESKRTPRATAK